MASVLMDICCTTTSFGSRHFLPMQSRKHQRVRECVSVWISVSVHEWDQHYSFFSADIIWRADRQLWARK